MTVSLELKMRTDAGREPSKYLSRLRTLEVSQWKLIGDESMDFAFPPKPCFPSSKSR